MDTKGLAISIRIWSLREDGSLYTVVQSYSTNIKSKEDFKEFKDRVNSNIDNYIKVALEESHYLPLSDYIKKLC